MERFLTESGVDFYAPSIGTEHRARNPEGVDKLYREDLAKELHAKVASMPQYASVEGHGVQPARFELPRSSNPANVGLQEKLHGMAIFRYYTGLSKKQGQALAQWVDDGAKRIAANAKEGLHVNASSGRDWYLVEQLQPELTQVMVNIGYESLA